MSKQLVKSFQQDLFSAEGKALNNYLGQDKKRLSKFLTAVGTAISRTPKLLECDRPSLMKSFVHAAHLNLDPSGISGECYVLPYKGQAQFQMGYKGYVTLLYRSGISKIHADIVREKDTFKIINGDVIHEVDPFLTREERGDPKAAYVQATYQGETTSKYMNGKDILDHGKKFSKSFNTSFTPWKEDNDPELWMWKKTVIIQMAKLLPSSDSLKKAIDLDYQDSMIYERREQALKETDQLRLSNLTKNENEQDQENTEENKQATEDTEE